MPELYYRTHIFSQSICSGSKLETTLIGHYMKSFFATMTKYFDIYERLILDHFNSLRNNSNRSVHDMMISMANNTFVMSTIRGEPRACPNPSDRFSSNGTLPGTIQNSLLQKALVETKTKESNVFQSTEHPKELSTMVTKCAWRFC